MKVTQVTIGKQVKVFYTRYESITFHAEFTAECEPGDDPMDVAAVLSEMCDEHIARDNDEFMDGQEPNNPKEDNDHG